MKPTILLPLAIAALGLAACSGSNSTPVNNETTLNLDEGADANLTGGETTDLNATDTSLNASDVNLSTDAAANETTGADNGATGGNAL